MRRSSRRNSTSPNAPPLDRFEQEDFVRPDKSLEHAHRRQPVREHLDSDGHNAVARSQVNERIFGEGYPHQGDCTESKSRDGELLQTEPQKQVGEEDR